MANAKEPICPKCSAPLKLLETNVQRSGARAFPNRQWICSDEDCMYKANHHAHA